jgi:hypothetical protein
MQSDVCLKVSSTLFKGAAEYFSTCRAIAQRADLPDILVKRKMVREIEHRGRSLSE